MATGRQRPQRAQAAAPALPVTVQERMAAKLRTPAGKALYARRNVIVEPVLGQSKAARGFRRFVLRGLATLRGEWRLVCLTHNLPQDLALRACAECHLSRDGARLWA